MVADDQSAELRRRMAALGLGFGPALFTIGEVVHHQVGDWPLLAAVLSLLGLYLWIAGILGIVHLLRPGADRLGLLGGAAALLGLVAVTNIMVLQLVFALVSNKVQAYPDLNADLHAYLIYVTHLFGPVFPVSLAVLAIGLLRQRIFPAWSTWAFLIGSATFPAGRIGRMPPLLHITDLVLTLGTAGMAWHLWRNPELWHHSPDRIARRVRNEEDLP